MVDTAPAVGRDYSAIVGGIYEALEQAPVINERVTRAVVDAYAHHTHSGSCAVAAGYAAYAGAIVVDRRYRSGDVRGMIGEIAVFEKR